MRCLFVNDAALTLCTEAGLQQLVNHLFHACKEFRLTVSLMKTDIRAQNAKSLPNITINGCCFLMAHTFTFIRLIVSHTLSLDEEVSSMIAKSTSIIAKLNRRVWSNTHLTQNTQTACIPCLCAQHTSIWQ